MIATIAVLSAACAVQDAERFAADRGVVRLARFVLAAAIAVTAWLVPAAVASAVGYRIGPWTLTRITTVPSAWADQGLTTVDGRLLTRGNSSIAPAMLRAGWVHIGDPSAWHGWVLDAYQGGEDSSSVAFVLTSPAGRATVWTHRLSPGETFHNSFTAIAPGGRWFVAGEWGTMERLLVFPMPSLTAPSGSLPLAGSITLSRDVRDVQGCAFQTATRMLCSTNDPSADLFPTPRQLLAVDLPGALTGHPTVGAVSYLGALPAPAGTSGGGTGEVEGIDVAGSTATVAVVGTAPDNDETYLYTLRLGR